MVIYIFLMIVISSGTKSTWDQISKIKDSNEKTSIYHIYREIISCYLWIILFSINT